MCGFIDNIFSGDGLFNLVTTIGSIIPGPWQPVMMAVGAAKNLSEGNILGAGLGALGAAGGFSNLGASLTGAADGLQGIGEIGDLYSSMGSTVGSASSGLGSTFSSGLGDVFSGMPTSLPSVGGGSAIGASDVFNSFGDNVSGFMGNTAGGGLGGMGSDLSASLMGAGSGMSGGGISDFSGAPMGDLSDLTTGGGFSNTMGDSLNVMSNAGLSQDTNLLSSLTDLFGQTQEAAKSPYAKLLGSGAKMLGAYGDYRGMRNVQNAYRDNLSQLDQLYSPDSPYAQQMQQTLSRRDAARGRNSQYGPRARELAANLTNSRASVMSSPSYLAQLGAVNQSAMPWASFGAAVPGLISGLGGLFK